MRVINRTAVTTVGVNPCVEWTQRFEIQATVADAADDDIEGEEL